MLGTEECKRIVKSNWPDQRYTMLREALKELIKASEERDTLKARVDELEKENDKLKIFSDIDRTTIAEGEKIVVRLQTHLKETEQDSLLGKALKKAFEYDFEVYKSQGCIVVETNTHDIELLDWYQQQLEKEETSGK